MPTITFRPDSDTCPHCGEKQWKGKLVKTKTREVATLAIGRFLAHDFWYSCRSCGVAVGSEELRRLVAKGCVIGYDVLVRVGQAFFLESRDNAQIVAELRKKNIDVCKSEVSYLARKFIVYLALLHKKMQEETKDFLSINGGYILHLDGTCEGGSPHLMSVLDGITEIVLDNVKLPSENTDDLIPFLEGIQAAYGEPVAAVSDMGKGILAALGEVFKNVPLFVCHFHFLKNIGKELFGDEYDTMRKRLKRYGIEAALNRRVRAMDSDLAEAPQPGDALIAAVEAGEFITVPALEGLGQPVIHALLVWALEWRNQGQGRGFPFDQLHLTFYQRLMSVYNLLGRFSQSGLFESKEEKKLYSTIRRDLLSVGRDSALKRAAATMLEKMEVFDRLRAAMRITLPENKRGLNDEGELCDMNTIEKEVTKFHRWLSRDTKRMKDKAYRKVITQLDKYWEKLFCDPIVVETETGKIVIQPQRTNNILEQFFRNFMRGYRKKNGFQAVARVLKAMSEDTPLVMNLKNEDFMKVLLAGKDDLALRFADTDPEIVRQEMNRLTQQDKTASGRLKKAVNAPTFIEMLTSWAARKAS
tara:strand:+ start:155 stop:1909 length:1755 start_codon:yes stop_codon:yes gene_type:complete